MNAQIAKTYTDGTVDILTVPVDTARTHVATRAAAADSFGIVTMTVNVGQSSHRWTAAEGWVSA